MAAATTASAAAAAASRAFIWRRAAAHHQRVLHGFEPRRGVAAATGNGNSNGGSSSSGTNGSKTPLVEKIGREELEVALANRETPLVVDFFSDWCGPCVMLHKELEGVKQTLGDAVRIVKLDTEEEPELASQLGIKALPTMLFIPMDASKPALRSEGLLRKEIIIDIIENRMDNPDTAFSSADSNSSATPNGSAGSKSRA